MQIDFVSIFLDGMKRYIITAVDIKSNFFACAYKYLSSVNAKDFMEKLKYTETLKDWTL